MKKSLFALLALACSPAFASSQEIKCEYPTDRSTYMEITQLTPSEANLECVVKGRKTQTYRVSYSVDTRTNRNLDTYTIEISGSARKLVVGFAKGSFRATGQLWNGTAQPIPVDCTRAQTE
jgi:hypothetical protein